MSLKAKLEAVIYAAEEPVTLAQLALLFTADALEWKAEQDAAAAKAAEAAVTSAGGETRPLIDDALEYLELDGNTAEAETTAALEGEQAAPAAAAAPEAETSAEAAAEGAVGFEDAQAGDATALENGMTAAAGEEVSNARGGAETSAAAAPVEAADAESELKREAKQRDRDVRTVLRTLLDELIEDYDTGNRGIEIREVAGGYRMATKPECHDAVRGFVKSLKPPLKLSLPALETLAVIAYKQPVTAPEVNEIRGVDSSGVFGSLLSRKLIATAGRKQVVGRPILYKTTREFLLRFGLKDVSELPSMEEFEKLAASELEEPEAQAESEAGAVQGPELDEAASEEPETAGEASNPVEPVAENLGAGANETAASPAERGDADVAEPDKAAAPSMGEPPIAEAGETEAAEPAETERLSHD